MSTSGNTLLVRPTIESRWVGGGAIRLTVYNVTEEQKSISSIEFDVSGNQIVSNHSGLQVTQSGEHVTGTVEEHKRKVPARGSAWVVVGYSGPLDPLPKNFKVDGSPADVPAGDWKPSQVTNLRVASTAGRSGQVEWDPSTDEVAVIGYEVTLVGRPDPITVTTLSARIGRLEPNTDYQVKVVAVNILGNVSGPTSVSFNSGEAKGERPAWDIPVMPFIDYAGVNEVTGSSQVNTITPIAQDTGVRGVSLGFITVANAEMEPCWGSFPDYNAINGKHNIEDVEEFKLLGGRPAISLGGWINHIPEYVHTDIDKVYGWYTSILDAYEIDRVDFDIEGSAQQDQAFLDRHISIVYRLLESRPTLRVSYTLPVDAGRERRPVQVDGPNHPDCPPDLVAGFNVYGKAFIRQLADAGILPSLFNGMTMTMGNHSRPQGTEAIIALRFMHQDVKQAFPHLTDAQVWGRLGGCPMFGVNDGGEFFHLKDMHDLVTFAKEVRLGCVGGWDAQRDWNSNRATTKCGVGTGEIFKCTREDQKPGDFLKVAATYQN